MIKQSFKENYKPGILLQIVALSIVLLYFYHTPFQYLLQSLGRWKHQSGILFSGVSTMIFGGLIPFLVIWMRNPNSTKNVPGLVTFYMLFWFWKGMEVDLFYQLQAYLFGDSNQWHVVIKKVVADQLVYCPIWAVPTMMVFYLWKDSDFSFLKMKEKLKEETFYRRCLRILFSNIVVWVPAVSIIYQLPLDLQMPLFNIVLAFWTLILNSISQK